MSSKFCEDKLDYNLIWYNLSIRSPIIYVHTPNPIVMDRERIYWEKHMSRIEKTDSLQEFTKNDISHLQIGFVELR